MNIHLKNMDDDVHSCMVAISKARGTSASVEMRRAFKEYVDNHKDLIKQGLEIMKRQKKLRGE